MPHACGAVVLTAEQIKHTQGEHGAAWELAQQLCRCFLHAGDVPVLSVEQGTHMGTHTAGAQCGCARASAQNLADPPRQADGMEHRQENRVCGRLGLLPGLQRATVAGT